jgi:hypothetical protein
VRFVLLSVVVVRVVSTAGGAAWHRSRASTHSCGEKQQEAPAAGSTSRILLLIGSSVIDRQISAGFGQHSHETNLRHNAGLSHLPPPNPLKATTTPPTPMFYTLFLLRQMRH